MEYRISWEPGTLGGDWWARVYDSDGHIAYQNRFLVLPPLARGHRERVLAKAREWCRLRGADTCWPPTNRR